MVIPVRGRHSFPEVGTLIPVRARVAASGAFRHFCRKGNPRVRMWVCPVWDNFVPERLAIPVHGWRF